MEHMKFPVGESGRSKSAKVDGPKRWGCKWTVTGENERSNWVKVYGPFAQKWTVLVESGRFKTTNNWRSTKVEETLDQLTEVFPAIFVIYTNPYLEVTLALVGDYPNSN